MPGDATPHTLHPYPYRPMTDSLNTITLGGGCFWCVEAVLVPLRGVASVVSGYAGGSTENPTYRAVCSGQTGHAEVVRVSYDASAISTRDLLTVFLTTHDPTTRDRQGADAGTQYRSVVLYETDEQRRIAEEVIAELTDDAVYPDPIVTEVAPLGTFYPAEADHQDYYARNSDRPYCQAVIAPKVAKLRQRHLDKLAVAA